jgi:hypothetical protein
MRKDHETEDDRALCDQSLHPDASSARRRAAVLGT